MSNEQLLELADEMAAENDELINYYSDKLRALATPSPQADKARGDFPEPAMVFNAIDHHCAFADWFELLDDKANFYSEAQLKAALSATHTQARPYGGEAVVWWKDDIEPKACADIPDWALARSYRRHVDTLDPEVRGPNVFVFTSNITVHADMLARSSKSEYPYDPAALARWLKVHNRGNWHNPKTRIPELVWIYETLMQMPLSIKPEQMTDTHPAPADVARLVEAARGVKFDVYQLTTPELRQAFDGQTCVVVVQLDTVKPLKESLAPFTTDKKRGSDGESVPAAHVQAAPQEGEWPDYVMLRDTKLYDDMGGLGQRIFTTAGAGYTKVKYVRADLAANPSACELGADTFAIPRHYTENLLSAACLLELSGNGEDKREAAVLRNIAGLALQHRGDSQEVGRV